jgi:hypothetical protein
MSKLKSTHLRANHEANPYGFFTARGCSIGAVNPGGDRDLWFIGLIVALALLTWGGVVLFGQLLRQP